MGLLGRFLSFLMVPCEKAVSFTKPYKAVLQAFDNLQTIKNLHGQSIEYKNEFGSESDKYALVIVSRKRRKNDYNKIITWHNVLE